MNRIKKTYVVEIDNLIITHLYGESPTKMRNFMECNGIDLILCPVTAHEKITTGKEDPFSHLFKEVDCPVLYVPETFEASKFRKVAYVLDLDDDSPLMLDDYLINLTSHYNYHITFLAVFAPGTNPDKLSRVCQKIYLNEKLKNQTCSLHLLQEQDMSEGFSAFVEELKVDLLVAGKKKTRLWDIFSRKKNFVPSPRHPKVPLLTFA